MSNDFFDSADYTALTAQTLARAAAINAVFAAIEAGFDLLPALLALRQDRVTYVVDSGIADACIVTLSPAPAAYVDGMHIRMRAAFDNTGAATINANSLGVVAITSNITGSALTAGQIKQSRIADLVFVGSGFLLINPLV